VTPFYPQKLALTSPTGGGRSVGIVRSRTKATGREESCTTCFGHHQVLDLKHLEQEYYCTINMWRLKWVINCYKYLTQ